jgi:hypothetical protein
MPNFSEFSKHFYFDLDLDESSLSYNEKEEVVYFLVDDFKTYEKTIFRSDDDAQSLHEEDSIFSAPNQDEAETKTKNSELGQRLDA